MVDVIVADIGPIVSCLAEVGYCEIPRINVIMESTKVLNPRRCIMRVTRNTHAVQIRMLYRYAATSFETVNTRASYVGR